jgi:hypothetical protein
MSGQVRGETILVDGGRIRGHGSIVSLVLTPLLEVSVFLVAPQIALCFVLLAAAGCSCGAC